MFEKIIYEGKLKEKDKLISYQKKEIEEMKSLIESLIEENKMYRQKEELVESTLADYNKAIELAKKAQDGYEQKVRELSMMKKEILEFYNIK